MGLKTNIDTAMIEKKENLPGTPDAESLAQLCLNLEATMLQAQSEVQSVFARLSEALQSRERQLLRQIDVAHSQQLALVQSRSENERSVQVPHLTVDLAMEPPALDIISSLGSVGLAGGGLVVLNANGSFLQSVEDYQDANLDHMSMFKPVPLDSSSTSVQEAIIRFSHVTLPETPQSSATPENTEDNVKSDKEAESPLEETGNCETEDIKGEDNTQKSEHPTQVQQWLKQLSAETETEPSIGEPKDFEPLQA